MNAVGHRLIAYTRPPAPDPNLRSAAIAYSLHLALEHPDGRVERLNDDSGVLFARSVAGEEPDVHDVRTLREPRLFRTTSGGFGVVALRCLSDGSPDPEATNSVLLFTSDDLLDFDELGLLELPVGGGVRHPWVRYDARAGRYELGWEEASGSSGGVVDDLAVGSHVRSAVMTAPVREQLPSGLGDAEDATTLDIDGDTAARLLLRYRRPESTGVDAPEPVYPFPFIEYRADPCILWWNDRYLFVATDDSGGDNIAQQHLFLRAADTLAALPEAEEHVILSTGVAGIEGCFWAPELHEIGGALRILFAPSIGAPDWTAVQCHIMTLRDGGDPTRAEDWSEPEPVLTRKGRPLQRDDEHPGISLDMTYFEVAGRHYYAWSQRYITHVLGDAEVWIATVDPAHPTRLSSDPVRLVTSVYGWDADRAHVAEGPFLLQHGDTVYLTYAGSAVGPTYVSGMLIADADADLLDPASWRKVGYPVLKTDPDAGEWGPGHNSFFTDRDGIQHIAYHAMSSPDRPGRHTALRTVRWGADGMPHFQ